jgi:solute carrier family 25 phosphate transporter 23/24/25/41
MEGDVSLSAEDKPHSPSWISQQSTASNEDGFEEEPEEHHEWLQGHTAIKFLLAGGMAGAGK